MGHMATMLGCLQEGCDYAVSASASRVACTDVSKCQRYGQQHGDGESEEHELIHLLDSPPLQERARGYLAT